jgi:hypothetical protein
MYKRLCIEEYLKKTPIDPVEIMKVVVGNLRMGHGFKSSTTSLCFHGFKTLDVKEEWRASFCAVIGPPG